MNQYRQRGFRVKWVGYYNIKGLALLENKKFVCYDACSGLEDSNSGFFDNEKWVFIGKGIIYSINYIKQHNTKIHNLYLKM